MARFPIDTHGFIESSDKSTCCGPVRDRFTSVSRIDVKARIPRESRTKHPSAAWRKCRWQLAWPPLCLAFLTLLAAAKVEAQGDLQAFRTFQFPLQVTVSDVDWSGNGGSILLANEFETDIWRIDTTTWTAASFRDVGDTSYSVTVSPDSRYVAVGTDVHGSGGEFQILRLADSSRLCQDEHPDDVLRVCWNSGQVVAGNRDGEIAVYPAASCARSCTISASSTGVTLVKAMALHPSNGHIAFTGPGAEDRLLFQSCGGPPRSSLDVFGCCGGVVRSVTYSPDGRWLAVGGTDGTIEVYSVPDYTKVQTLYIGGFVDGLRFSPRSDYLAAGNTDAHLSIFRVTDWARTAAGIGPGASLAWSPDQSMLAGGFGPDLWIYYTTPAHALQIRSSSPDSGVSITVDPPDLRGEASGVTPFDRAYAASAAVTLSAPARAGGFAFIRWDRNGSPFTDASTAVVTLDANATMTAVYDQIQHALTIESTPNAGVLVTLSMEGTVETVTTPVTRTFPEGASVTLTPDREPFGSGGNVFSRWTLDGSDTTSFPSTTVTMDSNHTLRAVYVPRARVGKVTLRAGDTWLPMKDVTVSAQVTSGPHSGDTFDAMETDIPGEYIFGSLPPADYIVSAEARYLEPALGTHLPVRNYPDWDKPDRTFKLGEDQSDRIPVIQFPEPVVLQAGWALLPWQSSLTTWDRMACYLSADPLDPCESGEPKVIDINGKNKGIPAFFCFRVPNSVEDSRGYDADASDIADHDRNAGHLRDWMLVHGLSQVSNHLARPADADRVLFSVVAHSMGGLITRAFISSYSDRRPPVFRIASLDAPHGGTIRAWDTWRKPALQEHLLNGLCVSRDDPKIVRPGWNECHRDLRQDRVFGSEHEWLLLSCQDDGAGSSSEVVSPDLSAFGVGRLWTIEEREFEGRRVDLLIATNFTRGFVSGDTYLVADDHSCGSGLNDNCIHSRTCRLPQVGLYLVNGLFYGRELCEDDPDPTPPALSLDQDRSMSFSDEIVALGGATASSDVWLDLNTEIAFEVVLEGTDASYDLQTEGGSSILPADREIDAIAGGAFLEQFNLEPPPTGRLRFVLSSGSTTSSRIGYGLRHSNGRRLALSLEPDSIEPGESLILVASLVDADGHVLVGNDGSFEARLIPPDDDGEPLVLLDDGLHGDGSPSDGIYGGELTGLENAGIHSIRVAGRTTLGGELIQRSAITSVEVRSHAATFLGEPVEEAADDDQDGAIDAIRFHQEVVLERDGSFILQANLRDSSLEIISRARLTHVNGEGPGIVNLSLSFPAEAILRHGVDGPYRLTDETVFDVDAGSLRTDAASARQTADYALSDFEPLDLETYARGNVGARSGEVTDVLAVNGTSGAGSDRTVIVDSTEPFRIDVAAPDSSPSGSAPFAMYVWNGAPDWTTVTELPRGVGKSCMSMPLSGGRPRFIANNFGKPALLGVERWPQAPTAPAPTLLLNLPRGTRRTGTFFIQGLIADANAPSGIVAVTNGVLVVSR